MTASVGTASLEIKDILSQLLKRANIASGSELARKLNLPAPTINRLLSGYVADPRSSTLVLIADYFNISVGQLLGKETIEGTTVLPIDASLTSSIPLQSMSELDNESINLASEHFHWNSNAISQFPKAFAVKIDSTKLEPTFKKNTILIAAPDIQPEDNDYLLVQLGKDAACSLKRYITDGGESYFYPVIKGLKAFPLNETDYNILGVVLEAHVNFKDL